MKVMKKYFYGVTELKTLSTKSIIFAKILCEYYTLG